MRYEYTTEFDQELEKFNKLLEEKPADDNIITVVLDETDEEGNKRSYQYIPYGILAVDIFNTFKGLVQKVIYETSPFNEGSFCRAGWKVFHPVLQEWFTYDGVGFAPINVIGPGEFRGSTKAIRANEEKLAIPLSAAEAFKNAGKFCARFGRDLNKDEDKVFATRGKSVKEKREERKETNELNRYTLMIEDCETTEDVMKIKNEIPNSDSGEIQLIIAKKLKALKK